MSELPAAYYSDLGLHNTSVMGRYRDLPVVGYNYEIGNPAAAMALVQMARREEIIAKRRANAAYWRAALDGCAARVAWMEDYPGHAYYQFPLRFPRLRDVTQLDALGEAVQKRGVPLIPPFWGMHRQPAYADSKAICPVSEYASEHVLLFPCYPALTPDDIQYMATVILEEEAACLKT